MKPFSIACFLTLSMLFAGTAYSQAAGGTGNLGFQLRDYGAIRLYTPAFGGTRQIDRMQLNVALDSLHVFDEEEDADTVELASLVPSSIADTVASVLTNNDYSGLPPNIRVRTAIYAWHGDNFFIVKFTTKNINTTAYTLSFGAFVIPKPDNIYGGETVAYDAVKKIGYYYRTGGTGYTGIKLLSGNPYSFHSLDWDVYSADPNSEATGDTTRFRMTSRPGFDSPMTASADGSVMSLNGAARSVAPGDSAQLYYAVLYGTSLAALQTAADAAVTRYNGAFTGVRLTSAETPDGYSLMQNYPNPFNPTTNIQFQIKNAGRTTVRVYDALGREVAVALDETLVPGTYTVPFDARALSSGVYFYRLTSGTFSETRHMTLIK